MTDILTPVGRLVMGSPFIGQDKDANNAPLVIKNGPNAGQPRVEFFMAVAVAKTDPGLAAVQATIVQTAVAAFPHMFNPDGSCNRPGFAFKMVDGDSQVPNTKGKKPCEREGFPGHVVFYFSSGFAPKCYTAGGVSLITDPEAIKRGYYVRINGSVVGNKSEQQPGVFLNHGDLELVGYGDEISSGPDGASIFGGAPAGALPVGASATPIGGVPLAPVTVVPGVVPVAGVPPVAAVVPAPDFLQPPVAAPVPPVAPVAAPPAPPAPPVPGYMVQGVSYTAASLLAGGYSQAQIDILTRG
jgi:hypothetical protein